MASKQKKITIAGMVYVLLFAGAGAGIIDRDNDTKCGGIERWDVKVLVDNKADELNSKVKVTTIEDMNAIPDTVKIKASTERMDMEEQLYEIKDVLITAAILESDNDIHIVIEDGKKNHMIAEIPDPKCPDAKRSDYINDYKLARKTMLEHKNDYNHYRFDITGVLFKDKKHPKSPTGNADNCIELHPVVKLTPKGKF
jgi:hypothetical protein